MPDTRKHIDRDFILGIATRANDYALIVLILVLGVVALAGSIGLDRAERAYQVSARV